MTGLTYVVTGGCGFLGTHIVEMLAQKGRNVSEIRVVDTKLRTDRLPQKEGVKISLVRGDVTDMAQMAEVCAGADVIIHTASLIDVLGLVSDETMWNVNVKGTENLLRCCVNEDVPCFVYTSSAEAVGPNRRGDPMEDGDESTPYDTSCPGMAYSRVKAAAEALVLQWNGRRTHGGKTLHTCALRPGEIYGDGEMMFIKMTVHLTAQQGIDMFARPFKRISTPSTRLCRAYVGNVAWAHLCAAQRLVEAPRDVGGQAFFVTDGTPVVNTNDLYDILCAPIGMRYEDELMLPLWLLYIIAYVLALLRSLLKPFYDFVPPINGHMLTLVNTTFTFNSKKATKLLGYEPLFTWEEAKRRTSDWLVQWKARGATLS